jgi:hypothetical protein
MTQLLTMQKKEEKCQKLAVRGQLLAVPHQRQALHKI